LVQRHVPVRTWKLSKILGKDIAVPFERSHSSWWIVTYFANSRVYCALRHFHRDILISCERKIFNLSRANTILATSLRIGTSWIKRIQALTPTTVTTVHAAGAGVSTHAFGCYSKASNRCGNSRNCPDDLQMKCECRSSVDDDN
jgi:hypothetical protein